MNATVSSKTIPEQFEQIPVVSEMNKIPGFDPRKLLCKMIADDTQKEITDLDLKFKKLWFRLVHPNGRITVAPLKITEQIAIIESKVFFDKNDTESVSGFIAQRYSHNEQRSRYIEQAQYAAQNQALSDAGFGIQFSILGENILTPEAPVQNENPVQNEKSAQVEKLVQVEMSVPAEDTVKTAEPVKTVAPVKIVEPNVADVARTAVAVNQKVEEQRNVTSIGAYTESVPQNKPLGRGQADFYCKNVVSLKSVAETVPTCTDTPESPAVPVVQPCIQAEETAAEVVETAKAVDLVEVVGAVPSTKSVSYTKETPVDDICTAMTVEEALAVVVDVGTCNGWTLSEVVDRRPASLKWYVNGYSGNNNLIKAGSRILLEQVLNHKAG